MSAVHGLKIVIFSKFSKQQNSNRHRIHSHGHETE